MEVQHTGRCVCGAVRFTATGAPLRVTICHCTWCQRRTGTAFGTEVVFESGQVTFTGDTAAQYRHRSDESGRWLDLAFCRTCGTNLGFTLEAAPELRTLPAGAFDDPSWIAPETVNFKHVFLRSRRRWSELSPLVEQHEQHFRNILTLPGAVRAISGRSKSRGNRMQWVGSRSYGVTLVALAGVLWSTGGLFVRALESLDLATMVAWRSLFAALALAVVIVAFNRSRSLDALRRLGRPGLIAIPIALVSMTSFVVSVWLTTVANVMIVYATVPFLAAGIGFLWNGERPSRRMLVAAAVAFLGVAIMAGAAASLDDLIGCAVALLMTATFATQLVMARRYPTLEMAPVNGAGAALCAVLFFPFASAQIPDPQQLGILLAFGIATTAGAYVLFLVGGRYIPSGEAGLIGMLDVVLAPLWVWLLFNEEPGTAALIGGVIVLASVLWYLGAELRAART